MTDKEVMQMAMTALQENWRTDQGDLAIEALRTALAQPEPEPVAWMHNMIDDVIIKHRPTDITRNAGRWTALYTAPPQRKPLSDAEMFAVFDDWSSKPAVTMADLCRAIEAAHGIRKEK